jgi:cell division septation protein DedD
MKKREQRTAPTTRLCTLLLLLLSFCPPLKAETVTVPIKLDYALLEQLMQKRLFTLADQKAEILDDPSGCNTIFLSNPQLSEQHQLLEIVTDVKASLGTALLGRCTSLLYWKGKARFLAEPLIVPGTRAVQLKVIDSRLYNQQGERITAGRLWDLAKGRFQPLLGRFRVDLAPSLGELGLLLPEVLPQRSAQQLHTIVDSLRLVDIGVRASGLDVGISFEVEPLPQQRHPETVLSEQELRQWQSNWQMMDAVITFAVKHYASTTKHQELRAALLEILLDARYQLQEALTHPPGQTPDPVRRWFVSSWDRLGPVIREISLETAEQDSLLWISLLTATDTLHALDRLGPAIGLDISSAGLRRLARLVNHHPDIDPLRYEEAIDPELQHLFDTPSSPESREPTGRRFNVWPIRSAYADSTLDRLNRWVPKKNELKDYLPLVRDLLRDTATTTAATSSLDPPVASLYRQLVTATAWQESCWRQYVVKQKKIVPLRSNTGDVGLMQMNETVWRGFYDIQKLRWDIAYNIRAGSEVLLNYLLKYALKRAEHKRRGGLDNLARATYAAYNGGPGQVSRYRNSDVSSAHKKIDAAFWDKFRTVKQGEELQVARCLGGETSTVAAAAAVTKLSKPARNSPDKQKLDDQKTAGKEQLSENWVLRQNKNHFTLQLAAFSTPDAARTFVDQQSLSGVATVYQVRKEKRILYAVLHGSYGNRLEAEKATRSLRHLKPWIRQFAELQK